MSKSVLRIMTYNLRNASGDTSPNTWKERIPRVTDLLERESPDIIGTQECLYNQVNDMLQILPEYDWIGLGREGGSHGEYMAIFYNKARLELLEYHHYWLSDTPQMVGSTTWGHAIPRMVTWGRFWDKQCNNSFYLINTHLDHQSEEARVNGAALIVRKTQELDSSLPMVVTGDFNTVSGSKAHDVLTAEDAFTDTWETAKERINDRFGTFNGFRDETGGSNRIDWILTRGAITTQSIKIVGDMPHGHFASDHFPVVAELVVG